MGADYTCTPNELKEILVGLIEAGEPAMIWGPPGIGKSDMMRQIAMQGIAAWENTPMHYIDYRALQRDPVDISGVPTVKGYTVDYTDADGNAQRETEMRTLWATPSFLPPMRSAEKYLINLEELSAAPQSVQASLYQLVLDREVGDHYRLPEGAAIVACGNRESDKGVAYKMPKPLANRFVHLELKTDVDQWCDWALSAGIATEVVFYMRFRPDHLFNFNPKSAENAFPTPRTWEKVSRLIGKFTPDLERTVIRGTVGEAAAVEFSAFLKVWRDLDDPQIILNDPKNARIPKGKSALIATCGSVARVAKADDMEAVTTYAGRLSREIGEYMVSSVVRLNEEAAYTRAYVNWCVKTA